MIPSVYAVGRSIRNGEAGVAHAYLGHAGWVEVCLLWVLVKDELYETKVEMKKASSTSPYNPKHGCR